MERIPDDPKMRRLVEVGRSLVSDLELDRVLRRVLEAAVDLTGARYAALGVLDESREGLERFVTVGVGDDVRERIGDPPTGQGVLGLLISDPVPLRLTDVSAHPASHGFPPGHPPMSSFLGVPITVGGQEWGNLYLTDKNGREEFDESDERTAVALAEWASIAIGNASSVANERLRFAMEAAEQERLQWARELHDETLQGLAAIRILLTAGSRGGPERLADAVKRSVEQIDVEIASMRALISDLRPDSLDELGITSALEGLSRRIGERFDGVAIVVDPPTGPEPERRLVKPIEIALYRVAQEAITNAIRHGGARRVDVELRVEQAEAWIAIRDEGRGFDPSVASLGYGIVGMRERAELAGGELEIDSAAGEGTIVKMRVPLS
ncbi:MAG TPA: GAF domain-containing sensor histidine kinase [Solirubrobacterales bacterium]|nr:GAF domain-containing sensor histidine kinase [Solirubrobacterales bacterium]